MNKERLKMRKKDGKSKDSHCNGQAKKDRWTNNDLQNITTKTKDRAIQTPLKPGLNFCYPRKVGNSCSTCDTSRVTLVKS